MRVLLVEDDNMIGAAVEQALREAAYAVDWVRDGQTALDTISHQHYDLALLDLGLPKIDGVDVLRNIRSSDIAIPVLIMTARDAVQDRISGLDYGADDYILKPFDMSEMLARMRAVVRRKSGSATPLLSNGTLTLNPASREITVNQSAFALTTKEFALLQALLQRPGAILSRNELEDRIYGWGNEVESNAIEFLIHSVRKKIGSENIKNIRGAGWMVPKEK